MLEERAQQQEVEVERAEVRQRDFGNRSPPHTLVSGVTKSVGIQTGGMDF
jgi:hypothetical protein